MTMITHKWKDTHALGNQGFPFRIPETGGSSREKFKRQPSSFPAAMGIVKVCERKPSKKKKTHMEECNVSKVAA